MSTNLAFTQEFPAYAVARPQSWQGQQQHSMQHAHQPGAQQQQLGWSAPDSDITSTPHIRALPSSDRKARPRVVYAAIAVVGLFVIVISQLLLSVGVSNGAYEISGLEAQQKTLSRTGDYLAVQLNSIASPQNLAANAEALGMVRNTNSSAFLRLSDGKVLGVPAAAKASAGSVIGAGNLVPNALLKSMHLSTVGAATATAATGGNVSAPDTSSAGGVVPLQDGLPAPTTR